MEHISVIMIDVLEDLVEKVKKENGNDTKPLEEQIARLKVKEFLETAYKQIGTGKER